MITIDDKYRLEDFDMRALDIFEDPTTTPFRQNVVQVPRSNRTLLISEQSEPRPIQIVARFNKDTHLDIESALNKFADIFYDRDGKRKEIKISLDHWQGKFAYGYLADNLNARRVRQAGSLEINLICYDTNRYSGVKANEVLWGSEKIDFTSHYTLGHEGNITDIDVNGNGDLQMTIFVDGLSIHPAIIIEGSSGALKITTNGQTIDLPSFSNSKWIIEKFTTIKNGQEVFVNARKFKLKSGMNIVTFRGSNKNFKVNFDYRDRYK